jgi:hypothetical protein
LTITQNGNSFTWTGTVTVTNATDITSGVATLMLTPNGGVGILPFLAAGPSGPPPVFDSVNVTTLAAGASATGSLTLVSSGGAGISNHYQLNLGIPQGIAGSTPPNTISGATDLEGGPPGSSTDQFQITWQNGDSKWKIKSQLCPGVYQATSFTAASGNTSPQTLATLSVPAQKFNWIPRVGGVCVPIGTINTHLDVRCLINNATSGQQVGYGYGITGAGGSGIPVQPVTIDWAFGGSIAGGYGVIAAGAAATFYFQVVQTAFTIDSFSVPTTPQMYFTVEVLPIIGTN